MSTLERTINPEGLLSGKRLTYLGIDPSLVELWLANTLELAVAIKRGFASREHLELLVNPDLLPVVIEKSPTQCAVIEIERRSDCIYFWVLGNPHGEACIGVLQTHRGQLKITQFEVVTSD